MLATQFNPSADDNDQYLSGAAYNYAMMKAFFDNLNTQMSTELAELGNSDRLEATIMYGSETLQVYVQAARAAAPVAVVINAEGKSSSSAVVPIGNAADETERTTLWIEAVKTAILAACRDARLFFAPRWAPPVTGGEPLVELPA